MHKSVWWWKHQCLHTNSELEGVCVCQQPAAVWRGWHSPAQLPERVWGLWSGGDPKLWGGLCDSGSYVQMAAAGEPGEWPGPGQPLGDPPCTGVWMWNSHSWTFIPIGVEGSRMIPSVLLVVAVLISHMFRLDIRKRLFMQRVFGHWRRVPREAVMASSLTESREHLDNDLRPMEWILGLSCAGPWDGFDDPCRFFPTQDILLC